MLLRIKQGWDDYKRIEDRCRAMEAVKRQYPEVNTEHSRCELANARKNLDSLMAEALNGSAA